MPILLLSGITLPLALAPEWIRNAARFNPFAYAVDASRALFIGHLTDASVGLGFGIITVLTVLGLYWAFSSFRRGMA
jgi:ABC-2 type transport system permease protein